MKASILKGQAAEGYLPTILPAAGVVNPPLRGNMGTSQGLLQVPVHCREEVKEWGEIKINDYFIFIVF